MKNSDVNAAMERARERSSGWVRRAAPAVWLLAGMLLIGMLVAWPMTFFYFVLASLPTIAMALMDDDPDRRGAACVGTLNLAGSMPFVLLAITGQIKANPLLWPPAYAYAYLGALLGFGIYVAVPIIAQRLAKVEEDREKARLSERQQTLIDEWGANVSTVMLDFSRRDEIR
jgi:hypothetical protein